MQWLDCMDDFQFDHCYAFQLCAEGRLICRNFEKHIEQKWKS